MDRRAAVVIFALVIGASPSYAQDARFAVTATSAAVHKTPSTASAVIGTAPRGKTLEVIRELGSWVRVPWPDAEDGVGYLHVSWGVLSHGTVANADVVTASRSATAIEPSQPVDSPPASALQATPVPATPQARPPAPAVPVNRVLSLPSRVVGLGARIGTSAIGMAVTGRAWFAGPLGAQIEAGQSTHSALVDAGQLRSVQLAPSVLFSAPGIVTNAFWVRPYLGAGMAFHRWNLRSPVDGTAVTDNGVGSQIFGGAEFTWASLPQVALSADVRRQSVPAVFDGFDASTHSFSIAGHWYVK